MLNEFFEKEAIPEIRALGTPEVWRRLPSAGRYGREGLRTLTLANGETWSVSQKRQAALATARDFIRLCDIPGFCEMAKTQGEDFHGSARDKTEMANAIMAGDDLAAKEIEKVLAKIESHLLITTGATVQDDIQGAVPNVPAFLSGCPVNMRTRRTAKTGRGPISLFLETTTSSGFHGRERIGRIAAMMALARALMVHRPINLWFNITWGGIGKLTQTAVQVETNPIDLSRVAAFCSHIDNGVNNAGMRDSIQNCKSFMSEKGYQWGSWAYEIPILERKFAGEILGRVISPGSEIAYLPAGLLGDDDLQHPEQWVERMLRKFAPYLFDGTEWDAA